MPTKNVEMTLEPGLRLAVEIERQLVRLYLRDTLLDQLTFAEYQQEFGVDLVAWFNKEKGDRK